MSPLMTALALIAHAGVPLGEPCTTTVECSPGLVCSAMICSDPNPSSDAGPTDGGTGGGSGTTDGGPPTGGGGGGGAVDGGAGDGGSVVPDPSNVWADLAWASPVATAVAVWVDDRRETSFGALRRRGVDLWVNSYAPDAGSLGAPYGHLLCPSAPNETLSDPRVAVSGLDVVLAWRVTTPAAAGSSIRVARLTSSGAPSSCTDTLVSDPAPISGLRLAASGPDFLLVWETPTQLMAQFVSSQVRPPIVITGKATYGTPYLPSLAASESGFLVGWVVDGHLHAAQIDGSGSVLPLGGQGYFPNYTVESAPKVAGPPRAVAFVGSLAQASNRLFGGTFDPTSSTAVPMMGPEAGPRSLVATALPGTTPRTLVAHQNATLAGYSLTQFINEPFTVPLLPGIEPLAMVAGDQKAVLLAASLAPLEFLTIPLLAGSTFPLPQSAVRTRAAPDQHHASAVWTDGGVWLGAWNEGSLTITTPISPALGLIGPVTSTAVTADFVRLVQVADGTTFAVHGVGGGVTQIRPWPLSPDVLLGTTEELRGAVAGHHLAAAWSPGGDALSWGQGPQLVQHSQGARYGRSGAWASDALWIPVVLPGNELAVIEIGDMGGAAMVNTRHLGLSLPMSIPSLAVRGSDFLLTAHDANGALLLVRTSVAELRANHAAAPVTLVQPRAVLDPVAAATPTGWHLAWESPDASGSVIFGMRTDLDGAPQQAPMALSPGFDDREPVLVASPEGPVLLGWHHFFDRTGSVVVQTMVLEELSSPDGGADAGVDAGVDAGTTPPGSDGGVSDGGSNVDPTTPIVFHTCGCQASDAGPLALAFVVWVLGRRRRS